MSRVASLRASSIAPVPLLLALAAGGCRRVPATSIVARVSTDLAPGAFDSLTLSVRWLDRPTQPAETRTYQLGLGGVPATLPVDATIVPVDGDHGDVAIDVAPVAHDAALFTVHAVVAFVPEHTIVADIFLASACPGVVCPDGTTCGAGGACVFDHPPTSEFVPSDAATDVPPALDAPLDAAIDGPSLDAPDAIGDAAATDAVLYADTFCGTAAGRPCCHFIDPAGGCNAPFECVTFAPGMDLCAPCGEWGEPCCTHREACPGRDASTCLPVSFDGTTYIYYCFNSEVPAPNTAGGSCSNLGALCSDSTSYCQEVASSLSFCASCGGTGEPCCTGRTSECTGRATCTGSVGRGFCR